MAATTTPAGPGPTAKPTRKGSGPRPPAKTGSTFTQEWNGLPVWAWLGIGGLSVAGLYVFIRGYRKAAAAKTSTATSTAPTLDTAGFNPGPAPFTPADPGTVNRPRGPGPTPAPPVTPAGAPGHVYTAQDVIDVFTRYGIGPDLTAIGRATVSPSSESGADRVARIVRELNAGTRTIAQVTTSIAALPQAAHTGPGGATSPPTAPVLPGLPGFTNPDLGRINLGPAYPGGPVNPDPTRYLPAGYVPAAGDTRQRIPWGLTPDQQAQIASIPELNAINYDGLGALAQSLSAAAGTYYSGPLGGPSYPGGVTNPNVGAR